MQVSLARHGSFPLPSSVIVLFLVVGAGAGAGAPSGAAICASGGESGADSCMASPISKVRPPPVSLIQAQPPKRIKATFKGEPSGRSSAAPQPAATASSHPMRVRVRAGEAAVAKAPAAEGVALTTNATSQAQALFQTVATLNASPRVAFSHGVEGLTNETILMQHVMTYMVNAYRATSTSTTILLLCIALSLSCLPVALHEVLRRRSVRRESREPLVPSADKRQQSRRSRRGSSTGDAAQLPAGGAVPAALDRDVRGALPFQTTTSGPATPSRPTPTEPPAGELKKSWLLVPEGTHCLLRVPRTPLSEAPFDVIDLNGDIVIRVTQRSFRSAWSLMGNSSVAFILRTEEDEELAQFWSRGDPQHDPTFCFRLSRDSGIYDATLSQVNGKYTVELPRDTLHMRESDNKVTIHTSATYNNEVASYELDPDDDRFLRLNAWPNTDVGLVLCALLCTTHLRGKP